MGSASAMEWWRILIGNLRPASNNPRKKLKSGDKGYPKRREEGK